MDKTMKMLLAEFLGTFVLVFLGGWAVASGQGVVVAAFAHGLAVVHGAYTYGHLSGAHLNPAVTLGLLVGGKVNFDVALRYWVVQFAAAVVAALLINIIVSGGAIAAQTKGSLTDNALGSAMLFEGLLTFILVSVVFQAAAFGQAGNLAGLAIGLTLAAAILAGGTYTGASLNPARTMGPAVIAGEVASSYAWGYYVAQLVGGALAGFVHSQLLKD